jgi:elongation of very long chain fatty acids protein 6
MPATSRWSVNMNFAIHSIMYSYYALKALRIQIPRVVNISITTLQTTQMLFGLIINFYILKVKYLGMKCDISVPVLINSLILYTVFFILFINYFIRTYLIRTHFKSNDQNNFLNNFNTDKPIDKKSE